MYLDWTINYDELKNYSLTEFDNEDGAVYGCIVLKLGKYQIGHLTNSITINEGNDDISFYVDNLIICGIHILKGNPFKLGLLSSNLLEISVEFNESVIINIFNKSDRIIEYTYTLSLENMIFEIKSVYEKYIKDIKDTNESLLQSKLISKTMEIYEEFLELIRIQPNL